MTFCGMTANHDTIRRASEIIFRGITDGVCADAEWEEWVVCEAYNIDPVERLSAARQFYRPGVQRLHQLPVQGFHYIQVAGIGAGEVAK